MGDNLDRFLQAAKDQVGDKYRFGAEVDLDNPDPSAFDSSELVEWAAHQAGVKLPDGSWNQYRHLHDAGATVSMDDALHTKGALVFGLSSDPLASPDRPDRAYGISLGNGKVLDISERSGEVREMDPGGYYTLAAIIPELHTDVDTTVDTDPPVLCYPDDQSTSYYDAPVDTSYDSASFVADTGVTEAAGFFEG